MEQTKMNNPLKWYNQDMAKDASFNRDLSPSEKKFVLHALSQLQEDPTSLDNDAMKMLFHNELQSLYNEIMHALVHSRGFITVKGFPAEKDGYDPELIKKFFIAFCTLLGKPLIQNKNLDIIFDVKSIEGMKLSTRDSRGPYVKDSLPMHTDAGAILGMYCVAASDVGGHTILSSSRAVHDEIQKLRPDLLEVLYQPFYTDRRGNEPVGALPYDINPVFAMYDDQLKCQYHQPYYMDAYTKFSEIPRLTPEQTEALELFDQVSLRKDLAFETKLGPGSVIFINNEAILHGRTAFDYPENTSVRHLFRIWLNTPAIEHTFPSFLGYPH